MKTMCLTSFALTCVAVFSVQVQAETVHYLRAAQDSATPEVDVTSTPLAGCGDADLCDSCCRDSWTLNLLAPSDDCFTGFISPMTNPVYFEDPRTLTEARFIYAHHKVPLTAGGGDIDLFAVQVRAAINDRLSIIATKDGYMTSSNPLIDDGWADINVGLKYNLRKNAHTQRILSAGATYELPVGSTRSLQGNGDGVFNLFLSGGAQLGSKSHWVSGAGLVLPADSAEESQWSYWSNHFDTQLGCTNLHPFMEVNWYHWMKSGDGGINGIEGGDLFNFGSTGVAGNDIVTGAIGLKYKPCKNTEIGVAWEAPMTERRDVLDNRLTFDLILRY
jgi:hypothetical protein